MYNFWGNVLEKISTNSKKIPEVIDRRLTNMVNYVIKCDVLVKNNSKARYFVREGDVGNQVQAPHETVNELTKYPSKNLLCTRSEDLENPPFGNKIAL